mmetsp:Transcript_14351/g.46089  ORF Transcript_14351/g.46089 Transcript_14351/m.46089 type:complete len:307 (-) Transcript_14351:90-1010(-)
MGCISVGRPSASHRHPSLVCGRLRRCLARVLTRVVVVVVVVARGEPVEEGPRVRHEGERVVDAPLQLGVRALGRLQLRLFGDQRLVARRGDVLRGAVQVDRLLHRRVGRLLRDLVLLARIPAAARLLRVPLGVPALRHRLSVLRLGRLGRLGRGRLLDLRLGERLFGGEEGGGVPLRARANQRPELVQHPLAREVEVVQHLDHLCRAWQGDGPVCAEQPRLRRAQQRQLRGRPVARRRQAYLVGPDHLARLGGSAGRHVDHLGDLCAAARLWLPGRLFRLLVVPVRLVRDAAEDRVESDRHGGMTT